MKRSDALAPLSRDHHQALEAALRLRRAGACATPAAATHFLAFWDRHGERHFEIEEELILDALADDTPGWPERVARVRRDHAAIRAGAAALRAGDLRAEAAQNLGDLLSDHVRFEERELFVQLETELDDAALIDLGERVAAAEAAG